MLVNGSEAHTEALRKDVARVPAPMCMRLSAAKTRVSHTDEGLDLLGFRIQRRREPGTSRRVVDTYTSKNALAVHCTFSPQGRRHHRAGPRADPTDSSSVARCLLRQLNPVLLGWCTPGGLPAALF